MAGWTEIESWVAPPPDDEQLKRLIVKLCPACGRQYEGIFVRCPADQISLCDLPPPRGRLAKSYECQSRIGCGELFDLFLATTVESDRRVIVKVLRREFDCSPQALKRFEQEQMIAAALQHKNIAAPLAFGALPEAYSLRPFLVCEYLEGYSLAQAFENWGACDAGVAAKIMGSICEAFQQAHQLGAVHSDLKPSNIFLMPEGSDGIKIVDFGVSQRSFTAAESGRASSGAAAQSVTSALYTAPELAAGGAASAATDIYAIGCLFYQLLTGRPPFEGSSALAIAYQHAHDKAEALPETVGSPDLRAALGRAMEREPGKRLSDLQELRQALA